ncbi:MAG: hypothetical protein CL868_02630 [Cytophagaceae bacterium]|nr:hypothetical protein [Cytophagaceae bacterium]|tara:strand:+ start:19689 stop:20771 length:1083 start_codon:yes stop_codon:yes gene_type:complete
MRNIPARFVLSCVFVFSLFLAQAQEKYYYDNGGLKSEGKLKDGKKLGKWKFYDEQGNLSAVEEHDRKYPDNYTIVKYFPNGNIRVQGTFLGGVQYNMWEWNYEDGSIKTRQEYIQGPKTIRHEAYYENGNLMEKGTIADKKLYGDWSYYNENGKLKENGRYDINGKKIGIWQTYHNDGNLKSKGNYENGLAHGEFDHYNEDGSILYTNYIGPEEKEDYFVPKEDKLPQSRSDRTIKTLYTTGQTKLAGTYDSPTMTWVLNWYFIDGQLKQTGAYKKNEPTGVWKTFYTNGALHSEAKYSAYGPRDQVFYHKNGNVKQKHENGATLTYYESGELKLKEFKTLGVVTSREYYKKDGTLIKKE